MLLVWSVAVEQIGELGKDGEYQSAATILIGFAIWKKMGQIKAWYIKLIDLLGRKITEKCL